MTKPTELWLARQRRPEAIALLCFPAAGATAAAFSEWRPSAAPDLEILPVKLPGRGVRLKEPAIEVMPALVAAIGEGIGAALPQRYAVFGQCLGGLLAYEVTRWICSARLPRPAHFFIAGCGAPGTKAAASTSPNLDEAGLIAQLRAWGGTPEQALVRRDFLDLLLPPLRSDLRLFERYEGLPGPVLDVPITALRGAGDTFVSAESSAGWRDYTTAAFAAREIEGGHFAQPEVMLPVIREMLR
jgi:surfactin synthase thioesterase subunit